MRPFVAVTHEITEDGGIILRFVGPSVASGRRFPPRLAPGAWTTSDRVVGTLAVWFARANPADAKSEPIRVQEVSLSLVDGLTPIELKRFGWSRWLTVADAIARTGGDVGHPSWRSEEFGDPATVSGKMTRALYAEHGIAVPQRRPGRKGHGPEFYRGVANRYTELRAKGVRSPTQQIAAESFKSRDTVAGWVKKARKLGFLPPARRGRAG